MRGRVCQPRHERQELGEATRPAICQDQRDATAAAGPFMHKMHPDTIDLGPEVTEPVQPAFLRAPVEAVGPVPQQAPQVTEVRALFPRRTRRRPWPPRVSDPRTQVGEDLVTNLDTESLRPERSHPASFARHQHHGAQRPPAYPHGGRQDQAARPDTNADHGEATGHPPRRRRRDISPRSVRRREADLTPARRADRRVGARLFAVDHDAASLLTDSRTARGKVAPPNGPRGAATDCVGSLRPTIGKTGRVFRDGPGGSARSIPR